MLGTLIGTMLGFMLGTMPGIMLGKRKALADEWRESTVSQDLSNL
jgi:putative Ca2+/H+ antiporter (TMEM165/GDT1 family)